MTDAAPIFCRACGLSRPEDVPACACGETAYDFEPEVTFAARSPETVTSRPVRSAA